MREILFRGKRVDNDEWATGYLVRGEHYIYETEITAIYPPDTIFYPNTETTGYDRVFPETIGQYTGLTDKNGKKIFEGDILRGFAYPFRDGEGKHNYYAEVVWFKNSPAFGLATHKNPKSNVVGISDGNCEYMEDWETFLWEVIGNIYDNPELLEVEND